MTRTPLSAIKLPVTLINQLKALEKPRQPIRGVIEELLTAKTRDLSPDTLSRLERYRCSPADSVDELIKKALDENGEFEKRAGGK